MHKACKQDLAGINNRRTGVRAKPQAAASALFPMMRFGRCLSTIFGEENFCIKKISDSCLRACREKIYHYYQLGRKEWKPVTI